MTQQRVEEIFRSDLSKIEVRTDRMFFSLLISQWIGAVLVALIWSPRTWIAQYWSIHQHVIAAAVLGGFFAAYPIYLIIRKPGTPYTRHMIAVGQMLQSALLVHVTGGRIETHFHVFGSLALLAFYRDWSVLITGGAVVALDHLALGALFPLSAYGVATASIWRTVEHAFWVVFETFFLTMSCRKGIQELKLIAERQVKTEELSDALKQTNANLENKVKERTKKLEDANRELLEAQQRLIQSARLESVGRLAAGAAHEVKNPLAIILGGVDFLSISLPSLDANASMALTSIRGAVKRADQVIRGLLDFSSPHLHEPKMLPLNSLLVDVLSLVKHEVDKAHIQVATELSNNLPSICLDKIKIEQVFVNLFINAIQAMKAGGTLTIRTYLAQNPKNYPILAEYFPADAPLVIVEVEDTGEGIPETMLGKVFDPFFTTKVPGQGTGLGLAVTKSIIELHKGTIDIRNRSEGGVRVTVVFDPQMSDLQPKKDEMPPSNGHRT